MTQLPLIVWVWTFLIFISIAWYAFLLVYVGIRGAKEIGQMAHNLRAKGLQRQNAEREAN